MENLEVGWWEFKVGKGLGREGFEGDERERRVQLFGQLGQTPDGRNA